MRSVPLVAGVLVVLAGLGLVTVLVVSEDDGPAPVTRGLNGVVEQGEVPAEVEALVGLELDEFRARVGELGFSVAVAVEDGEGQMVTAVRDPGRVLVSVKGGFVVAAEMGG
ncbi:MAG: hypothetical protein AAF547_06445 [Actinomycetota bacterium]